jgi:hypothetical protein
MLVSLTEPERRDFLEVIDDRCLTKSTLLARLAHAIYDRLLTPPANSH